MAEEKLSVVELYTDGACSGNPGPGGWAFILRHRTSGKEMEKSGGEADTTNNRMEMLAVINGLEALSRKCRVLLYTDSKYVCDGLDKWVAGWKKNGWRRRTKNGWGELKNVELWQRLDELSSQHDLQLNWVRGHSGHPENERCDELAVAASQKYM